jgi:putrescine transport system substrate-binding protein
VLNKLNRRSALTAIGGGLAMPFVRPSWAQAGTVNVYNWADYIGETTLADFEAATGIGVVYDNYSSAEEMQAKMLAGFTGYDVVDMDGRAMPQFIAAGVYQKIDRSRLPGWSNLSPKILEILNSWDPDAAYSMPYMWGTVGFAFNMAMIRERIPDLDLTDMSFLFDPSKSALLADCGISVLDSPTDTIPMALSYLGLDPNSSNPADYDKVIELYAAIRENIRTFDNNNYLNALPNGEVCLVNSWSGDYAVAATRAAEAGLDMELTYVVPKTGAPVWLDVFCIPADAPNADNAYAFLDFMLKPEVIAGCTNYIWYANANEASKPLINPDILNDPAVYPTEEIMSRMFAPKPLTEDQERAITRSWQTIKTG